jgi:hypothetical protein
MGAGRVSPRRAIAPAPQTLGLIKARLAKSESPMRLIFKALRNSVAILASAAIVGVFAARSAAEPRLLGVNDLTQDQQKILWDRVDRFAAYAVVLKVCVADSHFETRFIEAVRPCVEPDTVRRVDDFYRQRVADLDKRVNRKFCSEKKIVESDLAQKLESTLDKLVDFGHNLCVTYLKTGQSGLIRR